ncbi:MAG TPA: response regulator [Patescibacteria group bacterium]|nr:response regulator [Patescibacteria group bacterium]
MTRAPNAEPIHILYAEDQESDALFMEQAFLTAKAKLNLHFLRDGNAALAWLNNEPRLPDLIFLDINMLGMNGPQTLEEIRADPRLRHIPVIMLSGSALDRDVESCYMRHANAYVQKPLTFPEMLGFVQAIENFWIFQAVLPQEDAL